MSYSVRVIWLVRASVVPNLYIRVSVSQSINNDLAFELGNHIDASDCGRGAEGNPLINSSK